MAKYCIWSEEDIKEIAKGKKGMTKDALEIANSMMQIIEVANTKHNTAMLEKDVEYLELLSKARIPE